MRFTRQSGILLHPTSLPGGHGVGDFGPSAREFVTFLQAAGQTLWQMLPLTPPGYGDSPYQGLSAFAGNPLLISLDDLVEDGLLARADLLGPNFREGVSAYDVAASFKNPLLDKAAVVFARDAAAADRGRFEAFEGAHAGWLEEFALYMAARLQNGLKAWWEWPFELKKRTRNALEVLQNGSKDVIFAHKFRQFVFFRQYGRIQALCREKGIRLMGDIPIYVAGDSADVWSRRELWELEESGRPAWQAGVPPDYFSSTGQLWSNPIYRWSAHEALEYAWWVERLRAAFQWFDMVRLDHFRGFEAYWRVKGGEPTAARGEWIKGPGEALFEAVERALGPLAIVAENLGVITPEVERLRARFGYPGMAVLQFAFGTDAQAVSFRPHNYTPDVVAYTGTHDNDTTVGWWTESSTQEERERARRYLGVEDEREIHWHFIRALMASVASTVIVPAQDLLGLGGEARMNLPSTLGGNWLWRLKPGQLDEHTAARLREMAALYERVPAR